MWEPLNSEGFRKLPYNAADQKNAELCVPIFHDIEKDIPTWEPTSGLPRQPCMPA
ncbi:MAG: hypothetical protein LKI67_11055 [Olsenella sp.]|nr:hypothetical protein [Olsenella sp.]MCH3957134.1 hypothetical protein [Olsenella sp.]MCI1646238.1 hypothetical protein [Olsenella sp.]MCI1792613.1 hypothetical protein [Olsenella sp.]MCI1812368.1 hypothetical protein [Olsenella sp.]